MNREYCDLKLVNLLNEGCFAVNKNKFGFCANAFVEPIKFSPLCLFQLLQLLVLNFGRCVQVSILGLFVNCRAISCNQDMVTPVWNPCWHASFWILTSNFFLAREIFICQSWFSEVNAEHSEIRRLNCNHKCLRLIVSLAYILLRSCNATFTWNQQCNVDFFAVELWI